MAGCGSPWALQGSSTEVPSCATIGYGVRMNAGGLGPIARTLNSPLASAAPWTLCAMHVYSPESLAAAFFITTSVTLNKIHPHALKTETLIQLSYTQPERIIYFITSLLNFFTSLCAGLLPVYFRTWPEEKKKSELILHKIRFCGHYERTITRYLTNLQGDSCSSLVRTS